MKITKANLIASGFCAQINSSGRFRAGYENVFNKQLEMHSTVNNSFTGGYHNCRNNWPKELAS